MRTSVVVKRVITSLGARRVVLSMRGGQDLIVTKTLMSVRMRRTTVVQIPIVTISTDHTSVHVILGTSDSPTNVSVSIKHMSILRP